MILAENIYCLIHPSKMEASKIYKTILVATDGSEPAKHAIEYAAVSAEEWGASLQILSVVPPPPRVFNEVVGFTHDYTLDYEKAMLGFHLKILDDAKKWLKKTHPNLTVTTQVKKGYVPEKILEATEAPDVDLIVIGCRGLGQLSGLFLGSVSNHVVNHCKKPILVVK